jgi:hypothetical protein
MASTVETTNHETIRKWTEQRGGKPATVSATKKNDDAGLLRIDFPGYSGVETLEEITWDEFFKKFDEAGLQFLYQDKTDDGELSRFCKLTQQNPN